MTATLHRGWVAFGALALAAATAYFIVPSVAAKDLLCTGLATAAAVSIALGARRHRPEQRRAWLLLAAGVGCLAAGDAVWDYYELVLHVPDPFPTVGDVLYLASVPLMLRGLQLLVRARRPRGGREALLDAALLACSVFILSWLFVMAPIVDDSSLSLVGLVVSLAYPAADIALLFVALRLLGTRGQRNPSFLLLVAGLSAMLVADAVFPFLAAQDAYHTGHLIDLGWLAHYALWGVAGLHPSMHETGTPTAAPARVLTTRRVAAMTLLWVCPATSLLAAPRAGAATMPVAVAALTLLFVLVLVRFSSLVRQVELVAMRETAIRALAEDGERQARDLHEAQQQFAGMAAHELRTPLTSLLGSLTTLQRLGTDAPLADEMVAMSLRQARRLTRLSEDLLVVAATQAGELVCASEAVSLDLMLVETVQQLGAADRVIISGTSDLWASGDPLRLLQVFTNLVRNAMQYSSPDTVVDVRTALTIDEVTVTVRDHGPGIPQQRLASIFEEYGQPTGLRSEGLGVGLWIVKRLVDAMGGVVDVSSTVGRGSAFTVTLPAAAGGTAVRPLGQLLVGQVR